MKEKPSFAIGESLGVPSVLTIVFVVLKLCGVIDWPWVWVLSPTWISVILAVVLIVAIILVARAIKRKENK